MKMSVHDHRLADRADDHPGEAGKIDVNSRLLHPGFRGQTGRFLDCYPLKVERVELPPSSAHEIIRRVAHPFILKFGVTGGPPFDFEFWRVAQPLNFRVAAPSRFSKGRTGLSSKFRMWIRQ